MSSMASTTSIHDKVPKKRAWRSIIWEHYVAVENCPSGKPRSACKYCGTQFGSHSKHNGTTNMKRHLDVCKKYLSTKDSKQKKLDFLIKKEGESSTSNTSSFTQEGGRDLVIKMLINEELPLRFVESDSFRKMLTYFQPDFICPSRRTAARDIQALYLREKNQLKAYLKKSKQRVCFTTDCWTSNQTISYMVLTGHFIDSNWILHKRILNFCQIDDHKGETIGKMLQSCLHEWGIENVLTITVDNASANDAGISYLLRILKQWKGLVLNGEGIHVRCAAHIINLVVNDGLKEHQPAIERVRKAVKYVKSSTGRLQQFKNCIEMLKIPFKGNVTHDTPTRWNSTFLMLDNVEKYEKVFEELGEIDVHYMLAFREEGPPTYDDWANIREFCKFLKAFYDATLKVSASLHVTSNLYISEVCKLKIMIDDYSHDDNPLLRKIAFGMQNKFAKYWGDFNKINPIMFVAVLLDPMCKRSMLQHCISLLLGGEKMDEHTMQIEDVLNRLYSEYNGDNIDESEITSNAGKPPRDHTTNVLFRSLYKSTPNYENIGSMSEIEKYLAEKVEEYSDDLDILAWWKVHAHRYPTLSQIAKDVLITPVSTVASESAFSCGGRVVDSFRTSLLPETVEALICTQSWLCSQSPSLYDSVVDYPTIDEEITDRITSIEIATDLQTHNLPGDERCPMTIE